MTLPLVQSMDERIPELLSAETSKERRTQIFASLVEEPMTARTLVSIARSIREKMIPVQLSGSPIDTCGTGGSQKSRINTSTIVAFIVAAAGGKVAKHGNRAMSGTCGSFDLLEGLGINIRLDAKTAEAIFSELGLVFLYAPLFHPSMALIAPLRKAYGNPTIFNLVGPLCNPASVNKQIIGTPTKEKQDLLTEALMELGGETAMIINGDDGLDEISLCGSSMIRHVLGNHTTIFHPKELGFSTSRPEELTGGTIEENVAIAENILSGKEKGARRDLVLVNTAFALQLSLGIDNLTTAFRLASETLASGQAYKLLQKYLQASHDIT